MPKKLSTCGFGSQEPSSGNVLSTVLQCFPLCGHGQNAAIPVCGSLICTKRERGKEGVSAALEIGSQLGCWKCFIPCTCILCVGTRWRRGGGCSWAQIISGLHVQTWKVAFNSLSSEATKNILFQRSKTTRTWFAARLHILCDS